MNRQNRHFIYIYISDIKKKLSALTSRIFCTKIRCKNLKIGIYKCADVQINNDKRRSGVNVKVKRKHFYKLEKKKDQFERDSVKVKCLLAQISKGMRSVVEKRLTHKREEIKRCKEN